MACDVVVAFKIYLNVYRYETEIIRVLYFQFGKLKASQVLHDIHENCDTRRLGCGHGNFPVAVLGVLAYSQLQ